MWDVQLTVEFQCSHVVIDINIVARAQSVRSVLWCLSVGTPWQGWQPAHDGANANKRPHTRHLLAMLEGSVLLSDD